MPHCLPNAVIPAQAGIYSLILEVLLKCLRVKYYEYP